MYYFEMVHIQKKKKLFLELRISVTLQCFGVKDRVQQVLRVLRDFNFLSLFSPFATLFANLFSSTPIFPRLLFLSEASPSLSCISAYSWNERQFITELTNGRKSPPISFFFFFFPSFFIYLRLSLWEIPVGLVDLRWSYNAHVHLELNFVY